MSTTWELFRLQMDERIDLFKKTNPKKVILSLLLYVGIIAVATVLLTLVFMRFVTIGLYVDSNLLAVLLLLTQVLSFAIALASIFKTMYSAKDNDFLLSMPCSPNQLFVSKLMVLYAFEVIANTLYTLPIFIMYAILADVSVGFYILIPVFLLVLPLLALVVAALLSVPIMQIVNIIKRSNLASILSILLLVTIFLALYMWFVTSIATNIDFNGQQGTILIRVNDLIANLSTSTWLFKFMADTMLILEGFWWKLLLILVATAVLFVLADICMRRVFFGLSARRSEITTKTKQGTKGYRVLKPFNSILQKEFYTTFRNSGNVFQYFLFTLLMPFIVYTYDRLLLSITVNQTGESMIIASHLLVVCVLAGLSNIVSASAISREGGNFYIMKMSPVSIKTQLRAKIVFNVILTYSALIVTALVTGLATDIGVVHNILCTMAAMILSLGHIIISVLLDLRKPALDWFDESEIEKISKNTKIAMCIGLIMAVLLFAVVFAFAPTRHTIWPWSITLTAVSVFTAVIILYFELRVDKINERMEC